MSIFEITTSDIERLSDSDLRTLVGYLAEQELASHGLSAAAVTYGGHQNAKDGGVDVRVELSSAQIGGYIPRPNTAFQVKAEDMPAREIAKEMSPKGVLRPSIAQLGRANGSYIIVSSKGAASDTALNARRNAMAQAIATVPEAANLHLDFYDRRRMASWVNQHPGIVPWVRSRVGNPLTGWAPYADWSSSPGPTSDAYLLDAGIRLVSPRLNNGDGLDTVEGLDRVRKILAAPKGVVRLVGLSGVGKTRFVQALFDARIGANPLSPHLAVYTDLANSPDPLPLELANRLTDLRQRCVLIIDNCGVDLHRRLAALIRTSVSTLSVITVEYDISDDEPEGTEVFTLEPASAAVINNILERKHPTLAGPEIHTIADFSEGNFRVALALADTASEGDSLANLRDGDLFRRLFKQKNSENEPLLRAAKACSLVYSFDGESLTGADAELPVLADLAGQTVADFHAHVAELCRRKLIQKRAKWRALLPHALAHRLAKQALEDIPLSAVNATFTATSNERLVKSFSRRLGALHDSRQAQQLVALWLGPEGWLSDTANLNAYGLALFENVAPVNPNAILAAIRNVANQIKKDDEHSSRQQKFIQLLRSLAYDPELFNEAIKIIAQLAGSDEKTSNSGDAINVFGSLFHLYLSGTHAPVQQRCRFLKTLASSLDPGDRALSLYGLAALLENGHFSSGYGFSFGARKRDYGLHPRTWADVADWYRNAIGLASELEKIPALKVPVRSLIAKEFLPLFKNVGLASDLVSLGTAFAADGGWPAGWVGVRGALRLARKGKSKEQVADFKALADALKPHTLADRIISYVLPEEWSALDLADADFDDPKRYEKARETNDRVCREIGKELAKNFSKLEIHLPSLLSTTSHRVWVVGMEIGQHVDRPLEAWETVKRIFLQEKDDYEFRVLVAIFCGIALQNRPAAEKILDEALNSAELHSQFVWMQASVGVNDLGADRLIAATAVSTVPTWSFKNLSYGRGCNDLPGEKFCTVLRALSEREDGLSIALDVMSMRVFSFRSDKRALSQHDKACGSTLLSLLNFESRRPAEGHAISEVAKACLDAPGDVDVARRICSRLLESINAYKVSASDYGELVGSLAALFPRVVLDVLVDRGTNPVGNRREIFRSFREDHACALDNISDEIIFGWVDENASRRYPMIAEVIRPWRRMDGSSNEEEEAASVQWTTTADRLIRDAPDPVIVLNKLFARLHPTSWSGSLADILASRLPLIERLLENSDSRISEWANSAAGTLRAEISRQREFEAKETRAHDETFEW
jgi:hypothetical protein